MGPFSEEKQYQRASAIARLLEQNPNLSPETKAMWQRHMNNLSFNEETYNFRVKTVYSKMRNKLKGIIDYG